MILRPVPGSGRSAGVALITALLVTALAAVLAAVMLQRHSMALARAQADVEEAQALQYALGAEHFARQLLFDDFEAREDNDGRLVDALSDTWAGAIPLFEVDNGSLEMVIRDLNGRFNLNALADADSKPAHDQLRALLFGLGVPDSYADTLKDWVDADDQVTGLGAEDNAYLALEPPYRGANQLLVDLSELRLLDQMDPDSLALLQPQVTALPSTANLINVNTASKAVLQALAGAAATLPPLPAEGAREPWQDQAELIRDAPTLAPLADQLQVYSSFFEVLMRCSYGKRTVRMRSVLFRDHTTGKVELLAREIGNSFDPVVASQSI